MDSKKEFWALFKENKWKIVLLSILAFLVSLSMVVFAYLSKMFVDSINTDYFYLYLGLLLGFVFIEVSLKTLSSYLSFVYEQRLEKSLRENSFKTILGRDYSKVRNMAESNLLTIVNSDSRTIAAGVINLVPSFVLQVSRVVLSVALLFTLDWLFALIFLGAGILVFLITSLLRKKNKKLHLALQKSEAELLGYYNNSLTNLFVIKVFGKSDKLLEKEEEVNSSLLSRKKEQNDFNLFLNSSLLLLIRLSYVFAIIYCVFRLKDGLSIGTLLAIVELVSQIAGPFSSLSGLLPAYYKATASIERVNKVKELPLENKKENKTSFDELIVKDVSYSYSDGKEVLIDASFSVKKGEFVLIKGASGGGKSTLLKLISGVYLPSKGSIEADGIPTSSIGGLVSYVPQGNFLLEGSILDNLLFFAPNRNEEEIEKALKDACIFDELMALPNALNTKITDLGDGLSEGQGQRLSIARALLSGHEILILDESTSALDPKLENEVLKNIKALGKTVLFVSHKDKGEEYASSVYSLNEGEIKKCPKHS